MRVRPVLVAVVALGALAAPASLAATPAAVPQVTDPSGDANFLNGQRTAPLPGDNVSPLGSQDYADVVAVTWAPVTTVKKVKKRTVTTVTGFTVKAVLSAPPTAPDGTIVVYRMLGQVSGDAAQFLGVAFYSKPLSDAATPQSAVRDNLTGTTRLTKIDLPKVEGSTMTWTVPLTALPKEFKAGSTLSNLYFEVSEIEDFQGQKVPDASPVLPGASGGGYGVVDNGASTSSFKVG